MKEYKIIKYLLFFGVLLGFGGVILMAFLNEYGYSIMPGEICVFTGFFIMFIAILIILFQG
jgi:hypothetical protein